jgi:hypothetical protein
MPNYMLSASDDAVVLRNYEGMIFRYAPEDKSSEAQPIESQGVSRVLSGNGRPLVPPDSPRLARRRKIALDKVEVVAPPTPVAEVSDGNGNGHAPANGNGHGKANGKAAANGNGSSNGHTTTNGNGNGKASSKPAEPVSLPPAKKPIRPTARRTMSAALKNELLHRPAAGAVARKTPANAGKRP